MHDSLHQEVVSCPNLTKQLPVRLIIEQADIIWKIFFPMVD